MHEFSEDHDRAAEVFETITVQLSAPGATKGQWSHFERNLPPVIERGPASLSSEGQIEIPTFKYGRFSIYARKVLGGTVVSKVAEADSRAQPLHLYTEQVLLPSGRTERIVTPNSFTSYFRSIDQEWDGREAHFKRLWNLLAGDAVNNPNSPLAGFLINGELQGITMPSFLTAVRQLVRKRYRVEGIGADWGTRMLEIFAKDIDPSFNDY